MGEEQARIARELHDVIAHSVSVIVVQAAAADDVFDAQPDQARASLRSIERTGREALAELRRLLGAVRPATAATPPARSRGSTASTSCRSRCAQAASRWCVRREGDPAPLPAGVDLSAYRIVQEALTNTLRHARATRAEVVLRYGADELVVEVRDDGRGAAPSNGAAAATAWWACASARPCSAGRSRPARCRAAATACGPGCPGAGAVTVRVVIADDQALVRGGFRMILDAREDIEVVGEAGDGARRSALVERHSSPTSC